MTLERGTTIAHYRIDQKIGEGGMGIVYEAEDTRLGRRVALKILPVEMSADPDRRARFEREARAVAALNHPNIVTLYSVEESDGRCFLTMELVSGRSLTHLMSREGVPLGKLLDLSLGVADALVTAHRQGIVHRDLKPDNIMVTGEGRIKVLDFGLAKLLEPAGQPLGGTVLPTKSITEEGRILGTVAYMSPEQAEGKPLDHRSDIFSLGVVLYEMASGRRPFQGETAISTISSILKDTPTPLQQINTSIPTQLGRIVKRCLAKEPERRYQSTDDLRNELRELKEESDSGELAAEAATRTASGSLPASASVAPPRGNRRTLGVVIAGVVLLTAAIGAGWFLWGRGKSAPAGTTALAPMIQMSRATTDGKVERAAISPDGRYLAYVRRDGKSFSLRLRQVVTGEEVQVVPPSRTGIDAPAFSGDGNYLHYVAFQEGRPTGSGNRVSVLGGTPRGTVEGVWSAIPSPDGRSLAITTGNIDTSLVRIGGPEGENPRDLISRKGRDHFDSNPAWSLDGRSLAIVSHRFGEPQQLVLVDTATNQERPVPIPSLKSLADAAWLPGGDTLVVAGSDEPVIQRSAAQIWEVTTAGQIQPLTRDLNSYNQVSVTADGSTVAAVQVETQSGIDVADVRAGVPGSFTEVLPISASRAGLSGLAWIDSRRLAHTSLQGGLHQIFVTDTASKEARPLTSGPAHTSPSVSRDGRTMIALRADGDRSHVWRVDPETGREQQLTEGQFDAAATISPEGRWVVYSTVMTDARQLMKVPISGGTPVALTKRSAFAFGISPDGLSVYGNEFGSDDVPQGRIFPMAGGEPRAFSGLPDSARDPRLLPDGHTVSYLITQEGADELWVLPLGAGSAHRLVRFEGKDVIAHAWPPDGTRLAIVRVAQSGNVVLLKRTR